MGEKDNSAFNLNLVSVSLCHYIMVASFASAVPALPAFAQIMTYGEAIPTVVDMLRGDRQRVRRVLAIGTLTPVSMYMVWLAVTLGGGRGANNPPGLLKPPIGFQHFTFHISPDKEKLPLFNS